MQSRSTATLPCLLTAMLLWSTTVYGHGFLAKEEQFAAGIPVTDEQDWPTLSFTHQGNGWLTTRQQFTHGEIIRFVIHNQSDQEHLFAIGSAASLSDQGQMHALMPEQRTDYPNTRWLAAGAQATLTWEFNVAGPVRVHCLVTGHMGEETPLELQVLVPESSNP